MHFTSGIVLGRASAASQGAHDPQSQWWRGPLSRDISSRSAVEVGPAPAVVDGLARLLRPAAGLVVVAIFCPVSEIAVSIVIAFVVVFVEQLIGLLAV